MDKKPVTRKDIAELCKVSISVVSRALNNSGYVEESKRKKIIATAERLGYVPQPVAMSLQERRTKQILYYCKDLSNGYYIDMYRGMCQADSTLPMRPPGGFYGTFRKPNFSICIKSGIVEYSVSRRL